MAIAVDNLADADSLTTIEKDNEEEIDAQEMIEEQQDIDAMIERKKSLGSRRSLKSLKKRRNTQLHLDIEAAANENLIQRYMSKIIIVTRFKNY